MQNANSQLPGCFLPPIPLKVDMKVKKRYEGQKFPNQRMRVLTLLSSWAGSPGSRSGRHCRCSPPAYSDPPAASSSSEHPSVLQRENTVQFYTQELASTQRCAVKPRVFEAQKSTSIAVENELTSLLGLDHHLFILLPVLLGFLCRFGRQIAAAHKTSMLQ